MAQVFIPPALRGLVGGPDVIEAVGSSVRELIADLDRRYPGFQSLVCDGQVLRSGLCVTVDGTIGALGLLQPVGPQSEVHFLPAIGGG
jgi:molybdopterin synthase sulfur carrier subunit